MRGIANEPEAAQKAFFIQGGKLSDYWIKLYHEIIDDPKMATLPDRLWRRVIELFLLAGRLCQDKSGILPDTRQLAWLLRMQTDDLQGDLDQLSSTGIIEAVPNGWLIINFKKRQDPISGSERVQNYRARKQKQQYYNDVTQMKRNVTQINRLTESETESEAEAETPPATPPTFHEPEGWKNNLQYFGQTDYVIPVFCQVTGMMSIPGKEYDRVMQAMVMLHDKYPSNDDLINYLKPFFEAWIGSRTKDNKPFSRVNCAWLYDWAVAGELPATIPKEPEVDYAKLLLEKEAFDKARLAKIAAAGGSGL